MQNKLFNAKKYIVILLNAIVPLLVFFIPIFSIIYKDEEITKFTYNFYNMLSASQPILLKVCIISIFVISAINLIIFFIYVFDSYMFALLKPILSKILIFINALFLIASILIIVGVCNTIQIKTVSNEIFSTEVKFLSGSVILFVYAVAQFLFLLRIYKRKQLY